METVKRKTALFATPLIFFIAGLTAGRFYFLYTYSDVFASDGFIDIFFAFMRGVRFDLSTASTLSAPFILLLFFPGADRSAKLLRWTLSALMLWYAGLLFYLFIDVHYYAFSQRHITFEIGNTWRDMDVIVKLGIKEYFWDIVGLAVFLTGFAFLFVKSSRRLVRRLSVPLPMRENNLKTFAADFAALLAVIVISVVFIRGGLQMKPLGVKDAFPGDKVSLGALSLNGVYTTFNTIYKSYKGQDPAAFLDTLTLADGKTDFAKILTSPDREKSTPEYPLYRSYRYKKSEKRELNVVLFIMESWSAKHIKSLGGEISTAPNFDALAKEGLLLTEFFANGQRSMEGMAAILGSIPVWKGMILGQGGLLMQTRMEPLASALRKSGYETLFFHGARPGSMGFNSLVKRLGFSRHISMEDFEVNEKTYDSVWGIYDEDVFLRAHETFEKTDGNFFAVIYSLTSHSPYSIPSEKFRKFDKSQKHAGFLNSMIYSDYALGRFFEEAKKSGYFKNTIFIVTGDHTEGRSTSANLYESHRVPLLIYAPGIVNAGTIGRATSQLDISPTVLDLLKIDAPFTSWGKSIFDENEKPLILSRGDMIVLVDDGRMLLTDLESPFGLYDYRTDPGKNLLNKDKAAKAVSQKMLKRLHNYLSFSYKLITENRIRPVR
jgi:phosphoglycerol transferase MdoB-like AlkP superfamily enzyme